MPVSRVVKTLTYHEFTPVSLYQLTVTSTSIHLENLSQLQLQFERNRGGLAFHGHSEQTVLLEQMGLFGSIQISRGQNEQIFFFTSRKIVTFGELPVCI